MARGRESAGGDGGAGALSPGRRTEPAAPEAARLSLCRARGEGQGPAGARAPVVDPAGGRGAARASRGLVAGGGAAGEGPSRAPRPPRERTLRPRGRPLQARLHVRSPPGPRQGPGAPAGRPRGGARLSAGTEALIGDPPTMSSPADLDAYREPIRRFRETHERIRAQVRRVIVGQDETVEQLLLTLWAGGHC